MPHRRAKLTPFGRLVIVQRVEEMGWTVVAAAEAAGVSRATAHKWVRRYRQEGAAGLEDRSSAPRRCPHALPDRTVHRVLKARRRLKRGPHHLGAVLGMPRSTVYGVLRRHGVSRLDHSLTLVVVHDPCRELDQVDRRDGSESHDHRDEEDENRRIP